MRGNVEEKKGRKKEKKERKREREKERRKEVKMHLPLAKAFLVKQQGSGGQY